VKKNKKFSKYICFEHKNAKQLEKMRSCIMPELWQKIGENAQFFLAHTVSRA
jgi:hypothetical protein